MTGFLCYFANACMCACVYREYTVKYAFAYVCMGVIFLFPVWQQQQRQSPQSNNLVCSCCTDVRISTSSRVHVMKDRLCVKVIVVAQIQITHYTHICACETHTMHTAAAATYAADTHKTQRKYGHHHTCCMYVCISHFGMDGFIYTRHMSLYM